MPSSLYTCLDCSLIQIVLEYFSDIQIALKCPFETVSRVYSNTYGLFYNFCPLQIVLEPHPLHNVLETLSLSLLLKMFYPVPTGWLGLFIPKPKTTRPVCPGLKVSKQTSGHHPNPSETEQGLTRSWCFVYLCVFVCLLSCLRTLWELFRKSHPNGVGLTLQTLPCHVSAAGLCEGRFGFVRTSQNVFCH